jgi:hypothetical protein
MSGLKSKDQIKFYLSLIFLFVCVLSCGYFLFSPLGFVPVPWPDAPSFFLPWRELAQWPPAFKMHNYAAFVPSMDEANFGTMPALTVVLGMGSSFGLMKIFSPTLALKVISILALVSWACLLWGILVERSPSVKERIIPFIFGIAALWDPTLRWVTIAIRPEPWLGLIWILILRCFWRVSEEKASFSSKDLWIIAGWLALSAYFHFAAIVFVPAVTVALLPRWDGHFFRVWMLRLVGVGCRTLVFLSPWLIYCLLNFTIFIEQLSGQFGRLDIANPYFDQFLGSLFNEMGSPVGLPKMFIVAQVLLWFMIFILTGRLFLQIYQNIFFRIGGRTDEKDLNSILLLEFASALAFWTSFYLFYKKPEAWFVTLPHFLFWPWLGISWLSFQREKGLGLIGRRLLAGAVCGFALISVASSVIQAKNMPPSYRWSIFEDWVDCIDGVLQANIQSAHPKIWETFLPSLQVDLAVRHPNYHLTRILDYQDLREKAWRFAQTTDAIIVSSTVGDYSGGVNAESVTRYSGPVRPGDENIYAQVPFGRDVLQKLSSLQWDKKICQIGVFWAAIATRRN